MPNHRVKHPTCAQCGAPIVDDKPYTVTFPRSHGSATRDFCSRRCYLRYEDAQATEFSPTT